LILSTRCPLINGQWKTKPTRGRDRFAQGPLVESGLKFGSAFRLVKICNKKLCSPPQERTVAYASGSERCVLIPCNSVANSSASASASASSVSLLLLLLLLLLLPCLCFCFCFCFCFFCLPCLCFCLFRVFPWQILLLLSLLPSVANSTFLQRKHNSCYFKNTVTL